MVTASHNPPQDNGYKVYVGRRGPDRTADRRRDRGRDPGRRPDACDRAGRRPITVLGEAIVDDYVAAVAGLIGLGPRDVAHRPHRDARRRHRDHHARSSPQRGSTPCSRSPQQAEPDADFPTVAFPNPEEPGALDLALALARDRDADIIIANDPDADRCAVAVPSADGWRMLRGDEVGVLLADALLQQGRSGHLRNHDRVVDDAAGHGAKRNGVGYAETLTGFKWISRAADDLVFGYEEALGYAVAPHLVRDKDGISAALLVAELRRRAEGSTVRPLAAASGRARRRVRPVRHRPGVDARGRPVR